jgi:hypothetical protein
MESHAMVRGIESVCPTDKGGISMLPVYECRQEKHPAVHGYVMGLCTWHLPPTGEAAIETFCMRHGLPLT